MVATIEDFLLGREQFGMRFGLARMRRLLANLGDPQDAFAAVHVVGTNGKSSTTLMTAAALQAQGLATASFTSPHLITFRERIEIGCEMITEGAFGVAGDRVRAAVEADDASSDEDDRITQFEAVAAIAFCAYVEAGIDVAVVEAGLGGRLDATNVLGDSRVQVLTGVGIDHTQYLGTTLEQIAREKAAVVRSGGLLVSGPLPEVVRPVVNALTDERDANWIQLHGESSEFEDLPGAFVRANASLALTVADGMLSRMRPGVWFDAKAAVRAIRESAEGEHRRTFLQLGNAEPAEVHDCAHNPQAARALVEAVREVADGRTVTLMVAMLADKPVDATLSELVLMLPGDGVVVCCQSSNPRSMSADELARRVFLATQGEVRVEVEADPIAALARAREIAGPDGLLAVAGSNYLLADLTRGAGARPGATI